MQALFIQTRVGGGEGREEKESIKLVKQPLLEVAVHDVATYSKRMWSCVTFKIRFYLLQNKGTDRNYLSSSSKPKSSRIDRLYLAPLSRAVNRPTSSCYIKNM